MAAAVQKVRRTTPRPPPDAPGTIGHERRERTRSPIDDEKLLESVKKRLSSMESVRRHYEPKWRLNIAFYQGDQWAEWDRVSRRIYVRNVPRHTVRHVANITARKVDRWVAKLTKNRPDLSVEPATATEEDKAAARAGDVFLQYALRRIRFQQKLRGALKWAAVCGAGILRPSWDWQAGDWEDQPRWVIDEERGVVMDTRTTFELPVDRWTRGVEAGKYDPDETTQTPVGDVALDVVSPFDFFWDTEQRDPYTIRRCIERSFMPIEEIEAGWERGRDVKPEKYDEKDLYGYGQRLIHEYSRAIDTKTTPDDVRDKAIVYRYLASPSPWAPEGTTTVWSQNVLLAHGKLPWGLRRIPHVLVPCITLPWQAWPRALMDDLRRLQVERNKALSQDIEARNLYRWPKILLPHGCRVRKGAWNNQAGEKIWYTPVGPHIPKVTEMKEPIGNERHITRIDADLNEITAQHEVSQAQVPGGVRSGNAIMALQEQDDTVLGPAAAEIEDATQTVGEILLELGKANYDEERLVRVTGEINYPDVVELMGADLVGKTDVVVAPGSALPRSKYLRREEARELWKDGLITDPRRVLKAMDRLDLVDLYYGESESRQIQRRETQMLVGGEFVQADPEDAHAIHLEELERYMQTHKFDQKIRPEGWAALRQHRADHFIQAAEEVQRRAILAAYNTGGGAQQLDAGPGGPPPPGMAPSGAGPSPGRPTAGGGPRPGSPTIAAGAGAPDGLEGGRGGGGF